MSKMSKYASLMLPLMMMADTSIGTDLRPEDICVTHKQIKPPNGCKEYWFNIDGEFTNCEDGQKRMLKSETVFYCYASNDKNAIRKFNKWQFGNQHQPQIKPL